LCIYLDMFYTICISLIQIRWAVHFWQFKTSPFAAPDVFCLLDDCAIVHLPTAFRVKISALQDLRFTQVWPQNIMSSGQKNCVIRWKPTNIPKFRRNIAPSSRSRVSQARKQHGRGNRVLFAVCSMLVSSLAYISTRGGEAIYSSETSVDFLLTRGGSERYKPPWYSSIPSHGKNWRKINL
jgi:hypothetical protein